MKLFRVDVMDDYEEETIIVVAENELEAVERVSNMEWSCLTFCIAREVDIVDGYKIVLELAQEDKDEPILNEDGSIKDFMFNTDNKGFKCSCGCNVFHKIKTKKYGMLAVCNACNSEYECE